MYWLRITNAIEATPLTGRETTVDGIRGIM